MEWLSERSIETSTLAYDASTLGAEAFDCSIRGSADREPAGTADYYGSVTYIKWADLMLERYTLTTPGSQACVSASPAPPVAPETLPAWFDGAIGRIRSLKTLPANWDTYGADPLSVSVVDEAELVVRLLATANMTEPAVVTTAAGGVQLEWHTLSYDAEVEILPGRRRIYFEMVGSGTPLDVPQASRSAILEVLKPLRI